MIGAAAQRLRARADRNPEVSCSLTRSLDAAEHDARRGLRRWAPTALLVALFIQFGLTYLYLAEFEREPWPAVLLPGFGRVHEVSEGIESTRVELHVELEGGTVLTPTLTDAFAPIPQSMHVPLCRQLRAMSQFSPEIEAWLLSGARRAADGRSIEALELRWIRERRPVGGSTPTDRKIEEVRRVVAPR